MSIIAPLDDHSFATNGGRCLSQVSRFEPFLSTPCFALNRLKEKRHADIVAHAHVSILGWTRFGSEKLPSLRMPMRRWSFESVESGWGVSKIPSSGTNIRSLRAARTFDIPERGLSKLSEIRLESP